MSYRCPVRSGSPYSHDAAASGVTGALLVAGADFLESLLVLPVADALAGIKQTDATDERRGTCLRKRCSGLASALASLPGVSSQLNTSGRYSAPKRAGMPCVLSSSCTVSVLSGSHSW